MNQTSFSSLVVPVLPAIGLPTVAHDRRGAALHDAFHHRGDLVGGHRIEHLLAAVDQGRLGLILPLVGVAAVAFALVVLVDGVAVAVLDAVDQRRLDAPAAIVEHRIGGDHAQHRGLAGAERVGQIRRQIRHRRRSAWRIRRSAACRCPAPAAPSSRCATARCRSAASTARRTCRRSFPAARCRRPRPCRSRSARPGRASRACSRCRAPRIDERLERRARLAQRLRRAVELALVEGEAADHGEHAAGARIHHHHGAGDFGHLAQPVLALVCPCGST